MGKGFNNYMCKKFFHPSSRENLKRVWMAEQQADSYKKKQEELRLQYEKEQDLYTNKAIVSKESKEKLSVNFLYEPPPGTKKEREREDDEPEYKFEWQRKYNAPRESYCKGDQEIRDQPFGIQVRNVRCIKCHKWGHINTDKECPMYNQSGAASGSGPSLDPSELIRQMRDDGLAMKKGAVGLLELNQTAHNNQQLLSSSSEDEDHIKESEIKFLKGLSTKQKMKLLKKLEKLEKKKKHKKEKEKRKKKKKSKKANGNKSSSESSDSESDSDKSKLKKKIKKEKCDYKETQGEWIEIKKERDSPDENDLYQVLGRQMKFEGAPTKSNSKDESEDRHSFREKAHSSKSPRGMRPQDGSKSTEFHRSEHHNNHSRSKSPCDNRRGYQSESQSPRRGNAKRHDKNGYSRHHSKESKRRSRSHSHDREESRKRSR